MQCDTGGGSINGLTVPVTRGSYILCSLLQKEERRILHKIRSATPVRRRNIEMTPLCKVEVTLPRVLGSREVRRGGGVDEQAGVQSP